VKIIYLKGRNYCGIKDCELVVEKTVNCGIKDFESGNQSLNCGI